MDLLYQCNFRNRLRAPIAQAFVVTFALLSSFSPGVPLRANVPLWARISCLGPASATPHFNQALGSEIWAQRAGCTRAPFIWFQSSLRPRMWLRGHSFSRHWGEEGGGLICLEKCERVCLPVCCAAFIWWSSSGMDKRIHLNRLELRHSQVSWQAFYVVEAILCSMVRKDNIDSTDSKNLL